MRSHYLTEKGAPTGMFWAVRDALPDDIPYERWSRLFGAGVERRVRQLINGHVQDETRILDEEAIRQQAGDGSVCDLIVLYPEAWLAVEIVFRQMSRATQVDGDYEDLLTDLGYAAVEKLMQVDAALDRTMDTGLRDLGPPRAVYPLVVVGSALPSNPMIRAELERKLRDKNPSRLGSDPRVRPFVIIDLYELRSLLAIARRDAVLVPDLISRWQESNMANAGFRSWIMTSGPRPHDWWSEEVWHQSAAQRLFGNAAAFPPAS